MPYTEPQKNMSVESLFLQCSVEKLKEFCDRIEVCLGKLNEDQIWARGGENENAIGNLALHLAGNVQPWIVSSLGDNPDRPRSRQRVRRARRIHRAQLSAQLRETSTAAAAIIAGECRTAFPVRMRFRIIRSRGGRRCSTWLSISRSTPGRLFSRRRCLREQTLDSTGICGRTRGNARSTNGPGSQRYKFR